MNPLFNFSPIYAEDYNESDLSSYYTSTFVAYLNEEGEYHIGYVRGVEGNRFLLVTTNGSIPIPHSRIRRFVLPQGFYKIPGGILVYRYQQDRSYKKGLSSSSVKMEYLDGDYVDSWDYMLRHFEDMLYPMLSTSDEFIISHRLCVSEGKVYILSRDRYFTAGDYRDGVMDTRFPIIQQRFEEMQNASAHV